MVLEYHLFTIQRYKIISIYANIYTNILKKKLNYFSVLRSRQFEGQELPDRGWGTGSSAPSIGGLDDYTSPSNRSQRSVFAGYVSRFFDIL